MSEQTEQFKTATKEHLSITEEPTPALDDEPTEELTQEIKAGIQKIIIADLVNKLDEKVNKKVAEKVQCSSCGKSMSKKSLKYTHKCGDRKKLKSSKKLMLSFRRLALARLAPLRGEKIYH